MLLSGYFRGEMNLQMMTYMWWQCHVSIDLSIKKYDLMVKVKVLESESKFASI